MEIVIILLIVSIVIYFFISKSQTKQAEHKKDIINQRVNAVKEYFNRVNQEKRLPVINTYIMLKEGESACLQENVRLLETRKVTISNRGGGAVRVMKGVYIGGTSGKSRSHDELREIDSGHLILTNKRVVFDGQTNTRDFKLDKIISVSEFYDGIEMAIEGKSKSLIFTGISNPFMWKTLVTFIRQIPASGELPIASVEVR